MRQSFIVHEIVSGLRRNITMTLAMILTTAISLGLFGSGLLVVRLADRAEKMLLSRVEVQLFLKDDFYAQDPDCKKACKKIVDRLRAEPGVVSVIYLNKKQALNDAVNRVFANEPEIQTVIKDTGVQATIRVKVEDSSQIDKIIDDFHVHPSPGVDSILDQRSIVKRITLILDSVRNVTFILAIIQAITAILLIANMVQVAAQSRKTEMGIMSMVGASKWLQRVPFLGEIFIASFIGTCCAIVGLFCGKKYLITPLVSNVAGLKSLTDFSLYDVLIISPWLFLTGTVVSCLTGYITMFIYEHKK